MSGALSLRDKPDGLVHFEEQECRSNHRPPWSLAYQITVREFLSITDPTQFTWGKRQELGLSVSRAASCVLQRSNTTQQAILLPPQLKIVWLHEIRKSPLDRIDQGAGCLPSWAWSQPPAERSRPTRLNSYAFQIKNLHPRRMSFLRISCSTASQTWLLACS